MHTQATLVAFLMTVFGVVSAVAQPYQLNDNLSMFSTMLEGQWEGHFEDSEEPIAQFMTWEPVIGGAAIQMNGWATGSDMARRNIYYWDPGNKRVAYLGLTSNGYVATGTVEVADSLMTFTGQQAGPDGVVRDTRAEWKSLPNGSIRATLYWSEDGKWVPSHTILFSRAGSK